jgi:carbohydrate kinase (thermoresistant glucokinase family)
MKIIVMGVSGCGKSSIAEALAQSIGAPFLDGDDFHPAANKAKMAAGTPLNDEDRAPWLEQLRHELASRPSVVLACSALKKRYREVLRKAGNVRFVYLEGSFELIEGRMLARTNHFMKPGMLRSQFDALEVPSPEETDVLAVSIALPVAQVVEHALQRLHRSTFQLADGAPDRVLSQADLESHLATLLTHILAVKPKRILLLPPDHTRLYSMAGPISAWLYPRLIAAGIEVEVMPTLGTHAPMTREQCEMMFGDAIPFEKILPHRWREDLVTLGELPIEFMREISGGRFDQPLPVQVNKILVEGNFDLVISPGQVVPHEVIGLANYTKNICVGLGGRDTIHRSHFLGAVCNMETIMGRVDTPVRRALDEAFNRFIAHRLPVLFILTVMQDTADGVTQRGLYAGYDRSGYEAAARLSATVNFTLVDRAIDRCVVWLDPREFHTTWLGNKSVYRTRMAMADGGTLYVLAPALAHFGEDPTIDSLIRRHGYKGTPATLAAMKQDPELAGNLSAAAHLIHGSSEGRFRIVYCPGPGVTREEIEGVGFEYMPYEEAAKRWNPAGQNTGWHTDSVDGKAYYSISNPALGLWANQARLTG